MIAELLNKFKSMILRSKLESDQVDGSYAYNANSSAFDQTTITEIVYPYGYAASAPTGAIGITLMISNQPDNKTTIAYDPRTRFTGLKSGEAMTGNQIQQTFIKFNQDGSIDLKTNSIVNVTGNMTIKGNLIVDGTINSTGNMGSDAEVTDGAGTSLSDIKAAYNAHNHVAPGGPTSGPSTPI